MEVGMTEKDKTRLWVSRLFGVLISAALMAFLVLYYLKLIDSNMFTLGMLGFCSIIFILSAQFMSVKSSPFWVIFSLVLSAIFAIGFLCFLAYMISSGTMTI